MERQNEKQTTIFYPQRPGTAERINVDSQEAVLSPEQRTEIELFENELYDLRLPPEAYPLATEFRAENGDAVRPIETIWQKKVNSIELSVSYFMTDKGRALWEASTGTPLIAETPEALAAELSRADTRSLDPTILSDLQGASINYFEKEVARTFIESDFSPENLPDLDTITVYKNPEVLAEKLESYRLLKEYLRHLKQDVHNDESISEQQRAAKIEIIDIYRKRINFFIAEQYVESYRLLGQYHTSGNIAHGDVVDRLEDAMPVFSKDMSDAHIAEFLQRLDRYKYGVDVGLGGKFTWKSRGAEQQMMRAGHAESTTLPESARGPYADISPEQLKKIEVTSEQIADMIRFVLASYGFLSSEPDSTWTREREVPAGDDKWQVIVNNEFTSLSVEDKPRIVKVKGGVSRSLFEVLPVINHEVSHVIQHENKRSIGNFAIMNRIGMDRASDQFEAGGKWQEQVAREALSGESRETVSGTGYYNMLEVKSRGGSYGECVEAYFKSLRASNPSQPIEKAVLDSTNRARRLFRGGGHEYAQNSEIVTNSQPLIYLEQQLIYENLDPAKRKLLLVGGITLRNLMNLSRKGLVDIDNMILPEQSAWELLYPQVKKLVQTHEYAEVHRVVSGYASRRKEELVTSEGK